MKWQCTKCGRTREFPDHIKVVQCQNPGCKSAHMNVMNEKPPLGLIPKYVREAERLKEVGAAIWRYLNDCKEIPMNWIEEYNELVKKAKE